MYFIYGIEMGTIARKLVLSAAYKNVARNNSILSSNFLPMTQMVLIGNKADNFPPVR